jgi:hypothetical protein
LRQRAFLPWAAALHGAAAAQPFLDLWAKPNGRAAVAEGHDRAWHVGIPTLVTADAVAVGKAEEFGDAVRVEEVLRPDKRHKKSLYDR